MKFWFGVHNGKELSDETVPDNYLEWLVNNGQPYVNQKSSAEVKKWARDRWMDLLSAMEDELRERAEA